MIFVNYNVRFILHAFIKTHVYAIYLPIDITYMQNKRVIYMDKHALHRV